MRKTLTLPVKPTLAGTIAEYAKALPKPHKSIIQEVTIETRSRLFDPEILPVPKRQKMTKRHQVESTGLPLPPVRKGSMDRPDRSELKNNLTFNWDR